MAEFPPPLATDCHTHLVGELPRYPMVSPRSYTPQPATPADMRAMMDRLGLGRVVIVQISVYGVDNNCMIDGIRALGNQARGVVQVDDATPDKALDKMHAAGVRGIRVNLESIGVADPGEALRRLTIAADKCARNGWHLQLFASHQVISAVGAVLGDLPVPVVIDHFGLLPVTDRDGHAETVVRDLLASGRGWIKLSGTYRLDPPEATEEIAALARDLFRENPENILWGSDWPHPPKHNSAPEPDPAMKPYRDIDPARMLAQVGGWFTDPKDQNRILVDNPARLYDFPG